MKSLDHPVITALGATIIALQILLAGLVSPRHTEFYHLYGPVSVVVVPVLLNFAAVWLLLTLLLAWGRRHPRLDGWLWSGMAVALSLMLLKDISAMSTHPVSQRNFLIFAAALAILAAALVAMRSRIGRLLRPAKALMMTLLGFVALSGVAILGEVVYASWQARNLNAPRTLHVSAMPAGAAVKHGRIVWILFDEISYRQVYEHRYPGLALPAFDRLAEEATVFTHPVPAGLFTEAALPSLMTGEPINDVRVPAAGWPLEMHNGATGQWTVLHPRDTVFQDALDAGYSTGIAGWFNPYCRILPEVLDSCFWTSHGGLPGGMFAEQSVGWNSAQPAWHHLKEVAGALHLISPQAAAPFDLRFHQQDYRELVAAGDRMLDDPALSFLLLHMPIPHPGGIYNRHTASFVTSHPSYLDNLALCDVYLAHVRQKMEHDGTWDDATLVVMGDHSWRVHLGWASSPDWTAEESIAANKLQFDDRPLYLVKLPHQTTPEHFDAPFPALRTRSLFDNLLRGRIATPGQLAAWAARGD